MSVLEPGTIVDRFRVEGLLGAGSMGDVLRGLDIELNRAVAIKILADKHRENKELRARFVREARAVAAIAHPNVVQVFTTGTYDDRPYIAMELLEGVDLGTVIKEGGPMTSLQAARAALDTARGLEAAANAGLIHRDVKPSNLVLLDNGVVKVTDFGLAKPLDPGMEPALTALGVVVGTPDYIAPEQARGDPISEKVDIYALGGTIFFLMTAKPPFRKGNPVDDKYLKVVARHLKEPAPEIISRNKNADLSLSRLSNRMMAKKPDQRPGYEELIQQLVAVVDRLQSGDSQAPKPSSSYRTPSQAAPTPFIGGNRRLPSELMSTESEDTDESAQTTIRASTSQPVSDAGETLTDSRPSGSIHKPRPARWLVAVTILSMLVFLTGLGLLLFGPRPAPAQKVAAVSFDAAPPPPLDAAPPVPVVEIPDGMLAVNRADGTPWFYVDSKPITFGEYATLFPKSKKPSRRKRKKPVTSVSFDYAESYAESSKKRLLTPEEWEAAAKVKGFIGNEKLWEWVDDGTTGSQARRQVRGLPDRKSLRRPDGHANVTFRLGLDPGANPVK